MKKLTILFIHQNFPGQFKHVAVALQQKGHRVVALTASTNQQQSPIPTLRYKWDERKFPFETFRHGRVYSEMAFRGEIVARACEQLQKDKQLEPDVIVSHPGWGESLFLRDVWPKAKNLQFAEFYYAPYGRDTNFDPEFSNDTQPQRIGILARRAFLLQSFEAADVLLVPTHWQASTLPDFLKARTHVVFDGIDTNTIQPGKPDTRCVLPGGQLKFKQGDELLTFINRNLEPYRGYHIFMRALPAVMAARPNAQVVIVGSDDVSYSPSPPSGTWKQIFLDEVKDKLDLSRVHFVGRVPYPTFLELMRISRAHAYLTYPFVLSWSTLEAMGAGALVVGSKTPPVEEAITHGVNGLLVDFFDVKAWSETLIECLAEPEKFNHMRKAARQSVIERYDLLSVCLPKQIEIIEGLAQG